MRGKAFLSLPFFIFIVISWIVNEKSTWCLLLKIAYRQNNYSLRSLESYVLNIESHFLSSSNHFYGFSTLLKQGYSNRQGQR